MRQKNFLLILLSALAFTSFGQTNIDPTGTYEYVGKTAKINGTVFGPYVGAIQVSTVSTKEIVMTFFICKGAPSYNSGSFVDTLQFVNNRAIFTDPETDSTCKITFSFDK